MGSVRVRSETGKLFFDFHYMGKRCREQTALDDTPANRKKMKQILVRIEAEITLGFFKYSRYFPNSRMAAQFDNGRVVIGNTPLLRDFAEIWLAEMRVQWRYSHYETVQNTFNCHLLPKFGDRPVGDIKKAEILDFRSELAKRPGSSGKGLSPSRINHIMTPLGMMLNEAAERYEFLSPYRGIKSLKVPRTDVEPFSLEEVQHFLAHVRKDFRNYYMVRFFTGMRTAEIDGLKWEFVDFKQCLILVREALVRGDTVYTKNDGSYRDIIMSHPVFAALQDQHVATGNKSEYVFCTREGTPFDHRNITRRVWHPTLKRLGLKRRRPYQTRHTAATLWLAAGESPEWIARQMGHTTTEMLFRVYSRYVPNLTRNDGSAFERLLAANLNMEESTDDN